METMAYPCTPPPPQTIEAAPMQVWPYPWPTPELVNLTKDDEAEEERR
jgi:hypothetical protein